MSTAFPQDSVGLVTPQVLHFAEPLALACGRSLADYQLVYETYGELNAARKNVCYLEIDAPQGHDAFLIPIPRYLQAFSSYMNRIAV
ncbi:homoserine O-acetyltransferase [compost metagenome]